MQLSIDNQTCIHPLSKEEIDSVTGALTSTQLSELWDLYTAYGYVSGSASHVGGTWQKANAHLPGPWNFYFNTTLLEMYYDFTPLY